MPSEIVEDHALFCHLPLATTRWSVVTLDPGKRQMDILLLVDTTIEGASPSHARQE
jgi:hypothetical protein